jgi:undecaprenyl-phosphate 4-deoxy-4-formamido-L-arabinose transferase
LSKNFGEHNAVMAGLHLAEGDYCVIMDDDFQNPPVEVRKLAEEIQKGHDVVYVRYEAKRHSLFRNLGSRLHNWMATRALGKPADLYLSSFKILSQFVVREAVHYTGPDPYLDAIILRTTRKIGVVTARHEPRDYGESGYTFGKLTTLWGNMFVAFSLYPLRLLAAFGFIMSLVGIVFGAYTLVAWATPWIKDPDTYQTMNAATWFWRGLTFLAIGILGEYVGRIYMHLARDPQFIIRDIVRRHPRVIMDQSTLPPAPHNRRTSDEQHPAS